MSRSPGQAFAHLGALLARDGEQFGLVVGGKRAREAEIGMIVGDPAVARAVPAAQFDAGQSSRCASVLAASPSAATARPPRPTCRRPPETRSRPAPCRTSGECTSVSGSMPVRTHRRARRRRNARAGRNRARPRYSTRADGRASPSGCAATKPAQPCRSARIAQVARCANPAAARRAASSQDAARASATAASIRPHS